MATTALALVALSGVGLLVLVEGVAWLGESRPRRSPGVLAAVFAVAAGLTAIVAAITTLPIGDAAALAALGAGCLALVAVVLLRLAAAASRS